MTITQLIQSSPANANELFSKLAATSKGAVKTRETLFNDLKAELDLHSRLEEEHLFPVLRKHQETKELVRSAIGGNKQARALIAELDGMPKDSDEFPAKLAELRKTFQQHVRDEKKELLPAVKAALSDEEAQAVTQKVEAEKAAIEERKREEAAKRRAAAQKEREKVEAEKAAVEEAKRQEAAKRRAAAQKEREEAEARRVKAEARKQRALEAQKRQQAEIRAEQRRVRAEEKRIQAEAEAEQRRTEETVEALAEAGESVIAAGQSVAAAGRTAAQAGTEAAARGSQQFMDAVGDVLDKTGATIASGVETYSDRMQPVIEGMKAFTRLPPMAAAVSTATGKTWFQLLSRNVESRSRRSLELMQCLTPQQAAQIQTRYVGNSLRAWMDANSRMLDISLEAYRGVAQPSRHRAEGERDKT